MMQAENRSWVAVVAVAFMLVLEVVFVLGVGALRISHLRYGPRSGGRCPC